MQSIGIFEAKTQLTKLCEQVSHTRQPILISKRGKPFVVIEPIKEPLPGGRPDILNALRQWQSDHPDDSEDFPEVWKHRHNTKVNPLAD